MSILVLETALLDHEEFLVVNVLEEYRFNEGEFSEGVIHMHQEGTDVESQIEYLEPHLRTERQVREFCDQHIEITVNLLVILTEHQNKILEIVVESKFLVAETVHEDQDLILKGGFIGEIERENQNLQKGSIQ